jgi:multisubunit Na+/H+ antiporter MnhE subunit
MTSAQGSGSLPGSDGEAGRRASGTRRIGRWLGWWLILMVFWVITDDSIALAELLAGAGAAAVGAGLVEIASHQAAVWFGFRLAWLPRALGLPRQVLAETGIVFAALWRRLVHGEEPADGFVAEPARYGPDTPEGRLRRAAIVGARSLAPNSFVLGIDKDRDVIVVHMLVQVGSEQSS